LDNQIAGIASELEVINPPKSAFIKCDHFSDSTKMIVAIDFCRSLANQNSVPSSNYWLANQNESAFADANKIIGSLTVV
jgi:hypothetical protein